MKSPIAVLALLFTIPIHLSAGKPNVEFGPDGVTFLDVQPGTRVAWISLTRTRVASHTELRIDRGIEVARPSKSAVVTRAGADQSRSIWAVASVDEDLAGTAVAPGYSVSPSPIEVNAAAGAATIAVVSPEVELMYVRPKGGAWFISATDGGVGDTDLQQNTVITISLQSLERVQGNPHPPASTAVGDVILMINPRSNRTSVMKVTQ
jgi:hypothetical protein